MHILGELAVPGTISAVAMLVGTILRYHLRRMEIGLHRKEIDMEFELRRMEIESRRAQLGLVPGRQPAKASRVRHICRRRRLR